MNILLVNPPNCGRSIPEERYGITSLKQIFRGEPLALEVIAGNLEGHDIRVVDLKAEAGSLADALDRFKPDVAGVTGMTCEANTVVKLARQIKESTGAAVVVGGIHAGNDPEFFNKPGIDFVVIGLGKASFHELISAIEKGQKTDRIPGVAKTSPGSPLCYIPRTYSKVDLAEEKPPRYDLVKYYRESYRLEKLQLSLGFVASAYGCPYNCSFCSIAGQSGGRYLTHGIDSVIRDIGLLQDIPVIRLVDANTFGNVQHARALCEGIRRAGIKKNFLADVRSDTVVRHPDLMRQWKEIGLRSVVIGFEEIDDQSLGAMNKANMAAMNTDAIGILKDIGITIVGDFIIDPGYDERQFDALGSYIEDNPIDLPMLTVMTPLPGTELYRAMKDRIIIDDLDYYTLTNAVMPTKLDEKTFYEKYAGLLKAGHEKAKI